MASFASLPMLSRLRLPAVLPMVLSLALFGCGRPSAPVSEDARPVRTVVVSADAPRLEKSFPGEIRPRVESRLGFRVPGKIIERRVDAGARVKAGQVLARLDARDLGLSQTAAQAQVAQAQANFELAEVALRRTQALAAQNFVSNAQVDQAQTQLRAARAQLDAATAQANAQANQAGYASLVADRDGVVMSVEAEVGQVVSVGATVVRLAVGAEKDVVFNLPEQDARALKPGQTLGVALWSVPGQPLEARVRDISPVADPSTRTYQVKAVLEDPGNIAALGLTATAHLNVGQAPAQGIVVPLSAVVGGSAAESGAYVWRVDGDVARRTPVRIAAPVGSGLLITDGLSPGQIVITAGTHTIKEGQKVRLMPTAEADGDRPPPTAPGPASAAASS